MVNYLLDTNVVSDLHKGITASPGHAFIDRIPDQQLWLSVITVGEIQKGCSAMPMGRKRRHLQMWLEMLEQEFADRILTVNIEISHVWGEMAARTIARGFNISVPDTLIAATALHHGMHVVTRNVKDFEPTGVLLVNPWDEADS